MTKQRTRSDVAAAALGVDPSPSPSALAWSVAHAVAIECGRSLDDAMAIASRWATVADMVGEALPEPEWVQTGHDEFTHRSVIMAMDFNAVEQRVTGVFGLDVPKFHVMGREEPPRDEDEDRTCPKCGDLDCPAPLCRNRT